MPAKNMDKWTYCPKCGKLHRIKGRGFTRCPNCGTEEPVPAGKLAGPYGGPGGAGRKFGSPPKTEEGEPPRVNTASEEPETPKTPSLRQRLRGQRPN